MEFGYFTLSDNHYPDNPRSANDFVLQIREQALLADRIGMHSCWIGEHHFDSLGVNSRPDLLLANIASQTKNVRLAPAAAWTSPPAAATTGRNMRPSVRISLRQQRYSRKASTYC